MVMRDNTYIASMEKENLVVKNETSSSLNSIKLPVSLFQNNPLSGLETITKFIKEELNMSFSEIAQILNRDDRTIWGAYNSACKKMEGRFEVMEDCQTFPVEILQDRRVSVLEAITEYLKDKHALRYCQIASLLNRNDRTVWTVYKRAKKKRKYENN